MTNLDIKNYYDKGYSINYITDLYYNEINKNVKNYYDYSGSFIISKKNMTKTQCKNYVYDVIYNFNKERIELK